MRVHYVDTCFLQLWPRLYNGVRTDGFDHSGLFDTTRVEFYLFLSWSEELSESSAHAEEIRMISKFLLFIFWLTPLGPKHANASAHEPHGSYPPQPLARTCTPTSFDEPLWKATGLTFSSSIIFSTPAHQIDSATVLFNLSNTAIGTDVELSCRGSSEQLQQFFYGNIWYPCHVVNSSIAAAITSRWNGTAARFCFSRPTGKLVINQEWACRDRGPDNVYVLESQDALLSL